MFILLGLFHPALGHLQSLVVCEHYIPLHETILGIVLYFKSLEAWDSAIVQVAVVDGLHIFVRPLDSVEECHGLRFIFVQTDLLDVVEQLGQGG